MTGLAEVSLRDTPVLVAFKDACMSVLRNSLKLLLFVFVLTVVGVMVMFAVGLVVALVLVAAAFISQALSMVLMVLLYIPLLLVLYPLMFAGHYQAWKDLLDGDAPAPADDSGIVAA
jgi:hypothetical protein